MRRIYAVNILRPDSIECRYRYSVESCDFRFFGIVAALRNACDYGIFVAAPVDRIEVGIPKERPTNGRYTVDRLTLHAILVLGYFIKCLKRQQESFIVSECLFDFQCHLDRQIATARNDGIERLAVFADGSRERPLTEISFLQISVDEFSRMDSFEYVDSALHDSCCKYTQCKRICLQNCCLFYFRHRKSVFRTATKFPYYS